MRKLNRLSFVTAGLVALVVGVVALSGCGNGQSANQGDSATALSGTVSTNGSTSMEKVIGSLSEAFMQDNPQVRVTYDATGSGSGIEAVTNGSCDIGLASRKLKDKEQNLKAVTIALDGIAMVVNADCGVDNLSLQQVNDIFTGKIKNWKEVGGPDLEIACIGRENGSGTRDGFESSTKTKDKCKLSQELTSTGAVIAAVASSKNAIGYASLSSCTGQKGIKLLKIEGVECTEDNVRNQSYKIQRPFNLVLNDAKPLSKQAQAFVDFAKSKAAADLIRKAGAVPVV